jgi:glycogen operon protein
MDTVSFDDKHNEANGEDNRDGHSDNHSDNMGVEGVTDDEDINRLRVRRRRNMMATLMLSQGVPMILAGDEVGNSQGGNNNAYCQDNEIGWTKWDGLDDPFLSFCRKVVAFRKAHPVLRQERFLTGDSTEDGRIEIAWYKPDASFMDDGAWNDDGLQVLGVYLSTSAHSPDTEEMDDLYLVFNAGGDCEVHLPEVNGLKHWARVLDTGAEEDAFKLHEQEGPVMVYAQSIAVFAPKGQTRPPKDASKAERRRWFHFGRRSR